MIVANQYWAYGNLRNEMGRNEMVSATKNLQNGN